MRYWILTLLLVGCEPKKVLPETWSGIGTVSRTCAWAPCQAHSGTCSLTCVSAGASYTCVYTVAVRHYECARTSPILPAEAP